MRVVHGYKIEIDPDGDGVIVSQARAFHNEDDQIGLSATQIPQFIADLQAVLAAGKDN